MSENFDRRQTLGVGLGAIGVGSIPASAQAPQAAALGAPGSIERRIQKLNDAVAVENVMDRFPFYVAAGMYDDFLAGFALDRPDVRVEVRGLGVWQGREAVQKAVVIIPEELDKYFDAAMRTQFPDVELQDRSGRMIEMPLTTPMIEVADDCETAKGIWTSWGAHTDVNGAGKVDAFWSLTRFAVDFVKQNGEWKFWHFQIVPMVYTPYHTSWIEYNHVAPAYLKSGPLAPTRASSAPGAYDPQPPEPYATFARTWSY